jgi:hypothetical protein
LRAFPPFLRCCCGSSAAAAGALGCAGGTASAAAAEGGFFLQGGQEGRRRGGGQQHTAQHRLSHSFHTNVVACVQPLELCAVGLLVNVEPSRVCPHPAAVAAAAPAVRTCKVRRKTPSQELQDRAEALVLLTAYSAVSACLIAV